jgi:hypothetical protein
MNRTLVIGGLVALAVLLGVASWLLMGGRKDATTTTLTDTPLPEGPIALNPVNIVTKTGTTETPDGRTLNILFSDFELRGSGKEVKGAVFSTTWHLRLQPGERVAVATADLRGFMSSSAARHEPPPAPAPAADAEAPPADSTATQPAVTPPGPPPPPKPVAGDGVATVFVYVGGAASSVQWRDASGEGANRIQTQAAVFNDDQRQLRSGGTIPITVTVELDANGSTESVVQIDSVDLRLFIDNVPEPAPVAPTEPEPVAPAPPPPAPVNP